MEKYIVIIKLKDETLTLIVKGNSKEDVELKMKGGKYIYDSILSILTKQEYKMLQKELKNSKSKPTKSLNSNSAIYGYQLNLGRSRSFGQSKKVFYT